MSATRQMALNRDRNGTKFEIIGFSVLCLDTRTSQQPISIHGTNKLRKIKW